MLPKASRLVRSDFSKRALKNVSFPFGSIKVLDGPPRAAVVVSKKISSHAVLRNLLRRRVYAVLSTKLKSGGIKSVLIVYPNKKAASVPFAELALELERALARC
jgi:ribonuclease P protein component